MRRLRPWAPKAPRATAVAPDRAAVVKKDIFFSGMRGDVMVFVGVMVKL